jgi:hypothetical protein
MLQIGKLANSWYAVFFGRIGSINLFRIPSSWAVATVDPSSITVKLDKDGNSRLKPGLLYSRIRTRPSDKRKKKLETE